MLGNTSNIEGKVFSEEKFEVFKKILSAGEKIHKHNHPDYTVIFTVVEGKMKVVLGDDEEHILEPGKILKFDGENYIQALALENSQIFVTLIKK